MFRIIRKVIFYIVIFFTIYIILVIVQTKKENTHDVDLNLEQGTEDVALIKKYTSKCTLSAKDRSEFPKNIVGISAVVPREQKYFELTKELGVNWMRAEFDWREIEKEMGKYEWVQSDELVRNLYANNIKMLANINYLPTYSNSWETLREQFSVFMGELLARYKNANITVYEIFNEPNLSGWGWLDKKSKPDQYIGEYAIMLAVANEEIRKLNPNALIAIGGISSDNVAGMAYQKFLTSLLDMGAYNCFDILAFHPYGHEGKFLKTRSELDSIIANYGEHKSIWYNEFGTPDNSKLSYSIESMFKERSAVDAWFWFTLRDLRPNNRWNYGLLNYDYSEKPEFKQFSNLLMK